MGVRKDVSKAHPDFLVKLGEAGMRQLVSDHYDLLVKSEISDLFPASGDDLKNAKKHAADFMIQINGGPKYFNESRGAPQMVGRHNPFRITMEARTVWLDLYRTLLLQLKGADGQPMDEELVLGWWNYLDVFSQWMVNTPSS